MQLMRSLTDYPTPSNSGTKNERKGVTVEGILAFFNRLKDFLVGITIKGRDSGQKNVKYDSRGPNITTLVVIAV